MSPAQPRSQVIVVTGCSTGFGEVIARTLAAAGHHVFATMRGIHTRNAEAARSLTSWAQGENLRLEVIELDVADDGSVAAAFESIANTGAAVDAVVNNAGISSAGPLEAYDTEQMRFLYDVNVFGPLRVNKAVLPSMRARGTGLIVQVSSTLGRVLPRRGGLYPASKWAVEGLAESLAYEVEPFGIDVAILEPGAFPTTSVINAMRASDRGVTAEYAAALPRPPAPESESVTRPLPELQEIGDAVLRLVEMPSGTRPLRTVVGPIFTEGVSTYNEEYEQVRDHLREVLRRPDQAITWVTSPVRKDEESPK